MRNLLIGLILGGILGGGTTYFICDKRAKERENEIRAEARKEYKEYYERKQIEEDELKAEKTTQPNEEEKRKLRELTRQYDPAEEEGPGEEVDYAEEASIVNDAIQTHLEKQNPEPKIIPPESFGELSEYECETMQYFVHDKTLIHENEEIVDDIHFLIGDCLDRYGWADNDEVQDCLYVRKYKLQRDYEIEKVMGDYDMS